MKNRTFNGIKIFICSFLLISVVLPISSLLININLNDVNEIISSPQFLNMVGNSLFVTFISTFISVTIAFVLAWCVNRSNMRFTTIISMLFTIPMLIPSISHGMGLVLLLGDNGILTNLFNFNINLYGYTGIILGSVLYSFPVAFLMLTDIFKYEDFTIYEAAQVLGLSKFQQFKEITIPNMKGAMISVIFATFTLIFTDYGVPLVVGGKVLTLPVYMYREVIGLLDFSKGAIIGMILLIPAFIAFLLDFRNDSSSNVSTVIKPYRVSEGKKRDFICYIICIIVLICISLPIFAFALLSIVKQYPIDMTLTLDHIYESFQLGVIGYLKNSLAIAMVTSIIGMCVVYFTAYVTSRSEKSFSNMTLHLISMISLAIPGVVLGLCYVLFFQKSFIYGTLAILILVNIIHFFASPYLIAYNSLKKFNRNLEDTAAVMGISKMRMLFDVYVPCTQESLVEIFSYIFVNSMVTISAVSFLANFRNMPLALMIPQFDSQSLIEATAFISIIILLVNGILKICVYILKRILRRKQVM